MSGNLPTFRGGFTGIHIRVVQSPGTVSIFYDVGQGQGFSRVIPISDAPHLPPRRTPVVGRFARPLGGRHARGGRDELLRKEGFPGVSREPAPDRALAANGARTAWKWSPRWRIRRCGPGRGP